MSRQTRWHSPSNPGNLWKVFRSVCWGLLKKPFKILTTPSFYFINLLKLFWEMFCLTHFLNSTEIHFLDRSNKIPPRNCQLLLFQLLSSIHKSEIRDELSKRCTNFTLSAKGTFRSQLFVWKTRYQILNTPFQCQIREVRTHVPILDTAMFKGSEALDWKVVGHKASWPPF